MSTSSRFPDEYVDDTLDLMKNMLAEPIPRHLATLSNNDASKRDHAYARDFISHMIGNMVVVALAGLEHVIREDRLPDYREVMLAFDKLRPALIKHSFTIPPQINNAIGLIHNPQLDY